MTPGTRALEARHAELVARCAAERSRATAAMSSIAGGLAGADERLAAARRWARNPLVIAAGVALAVAIGRTRALRGAGLALGLLSAGLRARRVALSMREIEARDATGR